MTVYADSLFLMNFVTEYLLLLITEKIISVKAKKYRKTLSAAFGAIVSVLIFCTDMPHFICSISKFLNTALIISFMYLKNKNAVIRGIPTFLIISLIYSGIISHISGMISGSAVIKNGITYISINEIVFTVIFICTYPIVFFALKLIKERNCKKIFEISVTYNSKSVTLKALFDSGNLLEDNGKSVIIVPWDNVKTMFETDKFEDLYLCMEDLELKLLSYRSLGNDFGSVIIFYAGLVRIYHTDRLFENVPVGIINHSISADNTYNALVGKEYI